MPISLSTAALAIALLLACWVARALWRRLRHARRLHAAVQRQLHEALERHRSELQSARRAADAADLAKTRFVAAASHDLRQPTLALGLHLAALRNGPLAPSQAELAERMAASLQALQAMSASLLDLSRLDAGAEQPCWDRVPLAPLLHRLAGEVAPVAEARGLRLALRIADPAAAAATDALLLERILRNLLDNAVKCTPSGGVLLACRTRTAADGARQLRLEVWDSGVGIAPADQARVFDEFQQVDGERAAGAGQGLGLALVRRLAALLQVQVVLHSRPGRGSVFFVEGLTPAAPLPAWAAAAQARRPLVPEAMHSPHLPLPP